MAHLEEQFRGLGRQGREEDKTQNRYQYTRFHNETPLHRSHTASKCAEGRTDDVRKQAEGEDGEGDEMAEDCSVLFDGGYDAMP
jgi:hypothetical protein